MGTLKYLSFKLTAYVTFFLNISKSTDLNILSSDDFIKSDKWETNNVSELSVKSCMAVFICANVKLI